MPTTTLYDRFSAEYAALAIFQEDRITRELSATPALALHLPDILLAFRRIAQAHLHAVTVGNQTAIDTTTITQYIQSQLEKEASTLIENAQVRVAKDYQLANDSFRTWVEALRRRERWSAVS